MVAIFNFSSSFFTIFIFMLAIYLSLKVIRKLKESEIEEVYNTSLRYLEYKKGYDFRA